MQFLEHELAVEGREQQNRNAGAGKTASTASPAADSEQITRLENRVNALEALLNGLTEEVLDLKTVTRKLTGIIDRLGGAAPAPAAQRPAVQRSAVRRPIVGSAPVQESAPTVSRSAIQAQLPTETPEKRVFSGMASRQTEQKPETAEPAAEPAAGTQSGTVEYEHVMQPDGTILKRPKTKGVENVIIAGTGFGKGRVSHSSAIRAESSAVIEAEEVEETVQLE